MILKCLPRSRACIVPYYQLSVATNLPSAGRGVCMFLSRSEITTAHDRICCSASALYTLESMVLLAPSDLPNFAPGSSPVAMTLSRPERGQKAYLDT
jgi:hypothetical protein